MKQKYCRNPRISLSLRLYYTPSFHPIWVHKPSSYSGNDADGFYKTGKIWFAAGKEYETRAKRLSNRKRKHEIASSSYPIP